MSTEVVDKVKAAVIAALCAKLLIALENVASEIGRQPGGYTNSDSKNIYPERNAIVDRFKGMIQSGFDKLIPNFESLEAKPRSLGSLSLVAEADLEAMIALEGMVAYARNNDMREYLSFTTRLNWLLHNVHIDESNNPMDPAQIGKAFKQAIQPINLNAGHLLSAYRQFNVCVFHKLTEIFAAANEFFISNGILPNLGMKARNKVENPHRSTGARLKTDPMDRAFSDGAAEFATAPANNTEIFALLQNLMHGVVASANALPQVSPECYFVNTPEGVSTLAAGLATSGNLPGAMRPVNLQPGMLVGGQQVQILPQELLMSILTDIQRKVSNREFLNKSQESDSEPDLTRILVELLRESSNKDTVKAIDAQSSDIINLISLLYKAIWQDSSLPIPIKELVGRTQITIFRIALGDATFFSHQAHPARVFLNELAMAGIGWDEVDKLDKDPMYSKMRELITRLLNEFDGDIALFEVLISEFLQFKQELDSNARSEQRILAASELDERLAEINAYVSRKINERILEEQIHPLVETILKEHIHKFLVKLVLREGPGSQSWNAVIHTIDVLLWTVQPGKHEGDFERLKKIAPRLLQNIGKALTIAGLSAEQADAMIMQLKNVQLDSFRAAAVELREQIKKEREITPNLAAARIAVALREAELLSEDDEHLLQVNRLPIGIWMEFKATEDQPARCTLAARIDTIDKFIFVNRQGVKVVERSRMGLARELKEGTVKIISNGPLFDRAIEVVISNLRDNISGQSA